MVDNFSLYISRAYPCNNSWLKMHRLIVLSATGNARSASLAAGIPGKVTRAMVELARWCCLISSVGFDKTNLRNGRIELLQTRRLFARANTAGGSQINFYLAGSYRAEPEAAGEYLDSAP